MYVSKCDIKIHVCTYTPSLDFMQFNTSISLLIFHLNNLTRVRLLCIRIWHRVSHIPNISVLCTSGALSGVWNALMSVSPFCVLRFVLLWEELLDWPHIYLVHYPTFFSSAFALSLFIWCDYVLNVSLKRGMELDWEGECGVFLGFFFLIFFSFIF